MYSRRNAQASKGFSNSVRFGVSYTPVMCGLRLSLHASVVAIAALLLTSTAVAQSQVVRVRVAPTNVTAGSSIFITAAVRPTGKRCTATISGPATFVAKLLGKKAFGGLASWRWKVPRTAKSGTGTARVTCVGAGTGTARFRITALPPPPPPTIPARVVVSKSGIAFRASSIGSNFAGYGIVLQNVSPDEDALNVDVLVNIVDAGGRILKSESDNYLVVPAGATYYAGGSSIFQGTPARLEISIRVGSRQKKANIAIPQLSNVRVQDDGFGEARLLGEITNTSPTSTLSSIARITFVCLDSAGNVIGGGFTYPPGSGIPPNGRVGFETSIEGLSVSQIASVQVSVEPEAQ